MNRMLHGILFPRIVKKDTFEENTNVTPKERYDVILTNPPFGGRIRKELVGNLFIEARSTELAALQFCMKKLKEGGRCGIVFPKEILFRRELMRRLRRNF